ncbi:protein of unknown function [Klenkia marina]|uniref:DUF4349 domain-containing protein n=1 Tax=Klenkia marina TaxID=1960309 RepID=A0A1G4Y7X9_9ACTN|nr:DUF4349 domain-containing protein [Klenkia marina]SCX49502.1 protein of unknown function [Klenkia marina]
MRRNRWALAAVLSALLLGGCSGGGVGGADSQGSYAAPADAAGAPSVEDTERQVVTTADTTVAVDDPAAGAQQVSELVEDRGGRVDQRSERTVPRTSGDTTVADLVLRVPADELTGVLDELDRMGDLSSVSVVRDDVTSTAVDLDARISALQTSVTRLEALMAGAATTADLLAAEQELSIRQQDLEALQAERTALADQVELTTLSVQLVETEAAAEDDDPGFLGGLSTGWGSLTAAFGGALVVLGVLLPWLLVVAVAAAVAVPLVRRARRRARTTRTVAPTP